MRKREEISADRTGPAIRAADLGIWEWDLETNALWCSRRAKEIVGLAEDEEASIEKLHGLMHPEDRGFSESVVERSLDPALRERGAFEWRIVLPDGSIRWLSAVGEAEFAERDGLTRAIRYIGTLQDVSEQKLAELALRESELRLRIALDAGRMAVWEYDVENERLIGSPELNELLGFPRDYEPSVGEVREGYPEHEREKVRAAAREAVARGERFVEVEYRYNSRDGRTKWLLLRADIIAGANGRPRRLIGVLMDVSHRHSAEETNAYLAAVVSCSADAIVTFDRRGRILTWNEAAQRIFGYCAEETIGRSLAILSSPGAESFALNFVDQVWSGEVVQFESERRRKDGTVFHAAITAAPVRASNGEVISLVVTVRDATSRKNNERRQALLVRELHHRVRNTLATVQAIAGASARHAESLEAFRDTFTQRIGSLAQAHALLTEDNWQSVDLRQLLMLELRPYAEGDRIALAGPQTVLDARSAIPIGMAVHELTTNAAKHGALSEKAGRIEIAWVIAGSGDGREITLEWREKGGPPVEPPTRRGFGSLLLNTVLKMQIGANVASEYFPDGLQFRLTAMIPEPAR